jgi:DNA adenine methylase
MNGRPPHPIPYQGSKRALAPLIAPFVPRGIETWFEPFAGSAAMTLWAAGHGMARRYVLADALEPITLLWHDIIHHGERTAARYERVWHGQLAGDLTYFNGIRDRYNAGGDPVDLLYLICRCVKNAVRFNRRGLFTQSVDKRRLGMRPDKMRSAILAASRNLLGQSEVRTGDWLDTTADATARDFVYLDPPYLGTSVGRDRRYAQQMEQARLIGGLGDLRGRHIRFALSYDGMTGTKEYGPALPEALGLTRIWLHAGRSSQATLNGRNEQTLESLYLSAGLAEPD